MPGDDLKISGFKEIEAQLLSLESGETADRIQRDALRAARMPRLELRAGEQPGRRRDRVPARRSAGQGTRATAARVRAARAQGGL